MADVRNSKINITAADLWTDWVTVTGPINVDGWGTITGTTITLQKKYPDLLTEILDVFSWTTEFHETQIEPETGVQYRLGVKAGAYGSGTVKVRIGGQSG